MKVLTTKLSPADIPEAGAGTSAILNVSILKSFSKNGIVQLGEQAINVVLGMGVAIYLARQLGPSAFGIFMLCQSIIRMAMITSGFGLDVIILREATGCSNGRFITSAIAIYALNGCAIVALGAIWVSVMPVGDATALSTLLAMVPGLLFVPFEALEFWFRARKDAVSPAIARIIAVVVGSALKIALVAGGAGLVLLGWAHALQVGLVGFVLLILYRRRHSLFVESGIATAIRRLYGEAWPLFLTTLCTMIVMRVDILMLSWLKGSHEAGLYAAAIRLSEVANIVPVIIVTAAAPIIFSSVKHNVRAFNELFGSFLTLFSYLFLIGAVTVAFLSPYLISILFGRQFEGASTVLAIHIFGVVFIWQGVATQLWWIKRRRARAIMWRSLIAAGVNLLLNALLIPRYGGVGAAIASVVSQGVAVIGMNPFLGRNGRLLLRIQINQRKPISHLARFAGLRRDI